jgi:hypothetical protein
MPALAQALDAQCPSGPAGWRNDTDFKVRMITVTQRLSLHIPPPPPNPIPFSLPPVLLSHPSPSAVCIARPAPPRAALAD